MLSQAAGKQGGNTKRNGRFRRKTDRGGRVINKSFKPGVKRFSKSPQIGRGLADKSKLTVLKLIRKHIGDNPTAETLEEVSTFFGKDPPALEGMEEEKQQKMKALKKAMEDFEKCSKILKK